MPSSTDLNHALWEHLHTAILLVDAQLNIHSLNPACENLLEISQFRGKGQSVLQFFCPPASESEIRHSFLTTLHTAQPYTSHESTLKVHFKDVYVDYHVSRLTFAEQFLLLIEIYPINEKLKITQQEHAQQQHHIARQLIRSVAHEIKNPLGGIRGATQLLARQLPDTQYREFTDIILNEVDRLSVLADTMLGSRQPPSYEWINIHEPLERVRSLIVNHIQQQDDPSSFLHQIKIKRDYDLSLPDVYADRNQLIQVMLNICMNAVQAFEENPDFFQHHQPQLILRTRIQRLVTIQGVLHRSAICIDIEDNGIGVPQEMIESVFYPLVTGRAKGTGLGLSIAQTIMQQHHGMIECYSETSKTIFRLLLPWENVHGKSSPVDRR